MRQGLHDARNPDHNWDYHPLLFLGGLLGSLAVAGTRFLVRPPRQG